MPGFGPYASLPYADIGGGGSTFPTTFIPAPGYLYLETSGSGGTGGGAIIDGSAPINVYATSRESLQSATADAFVYRVSREALMGLGPTTFIPDPGYLYLESTGIGGIGGGADVRGIAPINVYATSRESLQSEIASVKEYAVSREGLVSFEASLFTYKVSRETLMSTTLSPSGIIRASISILW